MLRAMIVDDEAPARSELRFLLEQTGKIGSITEASSVRSAIEMLMGTRVDVVFLDISMPGASGLQLAEALYKLKNPPAIVFVTAYSDHAVEAFDVDAVDYLMKPVEEARLDRAIEKVIARAKPVPVEPVAKPTNAPGFCTGSSSLVANANPPRARCRAAAGTQPSNAPPATPKWRTEHAIRPASPAPPPAIAPAPRDA